MDRAMIGPPPDANFMKHYDAAMDVVMGGTAGGALPPLFRTVHQPALLRTGDRPQLPKPIDQTIPFRTDERMPVAPQGNLAPGFPSSEDLTLPHPPWVTDAGRHFEG
jgi:hypothetical protein